ncbi:MAG TPA: nucleotidyltransferase domain-containing protein [Candidatus Brocadiia bacterium]|nr:nucleotidyltransferase domain-containing protein [Candidatus Brocadiia bacterium]
MVTKTDTQEKILDAVVERLVAALNPARIFLFGSRARDNAQPDSDYDFLVVLNHRPSHEDHARAYRSLSGLPIAKDIVLAGMDWFHARIDVVSSLPATVLREGRLLYDSGTDTGNT